MNESNIVVIQAEKRRKTAGFGGRGEEELAEMRKTEEEVLREEKRMEDEALKEKRKREEGARRERLERRRMMDEERGSKVEEDGAEGETVVLTASIEGMEDEDEYGDEEEVDEEEEEERAEAENLDESVDDKDEAENDDEDEDDDDDVIVESAQVNIQVVELEKLDLRRKAEMMQGAWSKLLQRSEEAASASREEEEEKGEREEPLRAPLLELEEEISASKSS